MTTSGKQLSAFQQVKKFKRDNTQVINCKTKVKEVAEKTTTVFDPKHSGYNAVDSLHKCPVCLADMIKSTVSTSDGREVPVGYCLLHRTCLPQLVENT